MEITEVRVKLMSDQVEKLQAFCSVTFNDDFVVRDLKIIGGTKGPFVAMPSRKLMDRCPKCGGKNHLRSRYCNECGARQNPNRAEKDPRGRARLHTDIAHPINSEFREFIQARILEAFNKERLKAEEPGYVSTAPVEEDYFDDHDELNDVSRKPTRPSENWPDKAEKEPVCEPKRKQENESFDAGIFS